MNKKMIASLMIAVLAISPAVYGATNTTGTQTSQSQNSALKLENAIKALDDVEQTEVSVGAENVLTLDEAVEYALKNSVVLETVKNQADINKLIKDNASDIKSDLNEASDQLDSAYYLIDDGRDKVYDSSAQLDSAQALLDSGIAPAPIPVTIPADVLGKEISFTIPTGENIEEYIVEYLTKAVGSSSVAETITSKILNKVIEGAQDVLDGKSNELTSSKKKLEESTQEYLSSNAKYQALLQYAIANVANKLSTSTISSLETRPLGELVVKMATTQDEITSYSLNIYKNKIALLVQNSYYEALKQQKLLELKEKAVERGKLQYELAKAAYEVGAKSKDDMVIARTYYNSTIMARDLQEKDYNAALIALKTNMSMDLSKDIKLAEVEISTTEAYNLDQGINSGKRTRLETKMANAQIDLYKYLKTAVKDSFYKEGDNQYKEVELLQQKANIQLKAVELQVESDIRTSYSTMTSMQKIAQKSQELVADAKETVEIAKVKYEVGFGYDNALLASLNLESMSGTLVEVLAAEENLVNIEAKAIEAVNGYNLSRIKYLNDIGVLPYK